MKNTESQTATIGGQESPELTGAIGVRVSTQSSPVREDGGELEALQWHGSSHDGMIPDADGEWLSREDVESIQSSHRQEIARLTAERDGLKADVKRLLEENTEIRRLCTTDHVAAKEAQSELTMARELLGGMLFAFDDGVGRDWSAPLLDEARKFFPAVEFKLAHQSAPAAKGGV